MNVRNTEGTLDPGSEHFMENSSNCKSDQAENEKLRSITTIGTAKIRITFN
jgi:hypothetical protein